MTVIEAETLLRRKLDRRKKLNENRPSWMPPIRSIQITFAQAEDIFGALDGAARVCCACDEALTAEGA